MKSIYCVLYIVTLPILYSCTATPKSNRRDVYGGYELGMSKDKASADFATKMNNGVYHTKSDKYDKIIYEEHFLNSGKKYYSVLQFIAPDYDTLLVGLSLVFSRVPTMSLHKALEFQKLTHQEFLINDGYDGYNAGYPEGEIISDLQNKLIARYGNYDDSLINGTDVAGTQIYYWKDRDNVDITLKRAYELRVDQWVYHQYRYSITLKYLYTEKMLKKLNLKTSKF